MSALKLYELVGQHRELERLADSGEVPAEVIRDTIEAPEGDIQVKSISVAQFVRNLEVGADVIEDAAKQMRRARRWLRRRREA